VTADLIVRALLDSDEDAEYEEYARLAAGPLALLRHAVVSGQAETVEIKSPTREDKMTISVKGPEEYNKSSKLRFIRVTWYTRQTMGSPETKGGSGAYRADNAENVTAALYNLIKKFQEWNSPHAYTNYPVDEAYRKLISQCWQPKHAKRGYSSHRFWSELGQWPPRRRR
jgi:hypothetical protein